MACLLLINGPNLNLPATRKPGVYGDTNLARVEERLTALSRESGHDPDCFQSNAEHEIVDRVQLASKHCKYILLNGGAYTHISVAIRNALLAVEIPFIEIHLSNVFAREDFSHKSYFSDIAQGCIFGLGAFGYDIALQAASRLPSEEK